MKRIVFLIQDQPNWTGGPIINVRRLLPALKAEGYTILAPTGYRQDAPNARFLEEQGISCPLFALPAATEDYVAWILEQVLAFKPDVFIGDTHVAGGYALKYLNEWGIPSIVMARSVDAYNTEIARTFFIQNSAYRAHALVCVNQNIANNLAKLPDARPALIKVIPSGGPISPFIATYQHSPFKLVYAGVLRDEPKRLLKLWDAFVFAQETMPDLELTFIGDGPLRPDLELRIQQAGLNHKVTFTGVLHDERYKEMLARHQALLLFSDFEGTPGSVMDAMSCGVVPLCRKIYGIDFLIKDGQNGLLFDGTNEDFLAKLQVLRMESNWQHFSKQTKQDFDAQFSLPTVVQRWQALMENLMVNPSKFAQAVLPSKIHLPAVKFHLANADRRKDWYNKILRGIYVVIQRMKK